MKQPFSQGKNAWGSTLKSNAQSKGTVGRTSQDKKADKKLVGGLGKAMKGLAVIVIAFAFTHVASAHSIDFVACIKHKGELSVIPVKGLNFFYRCSISIDTDYLSDLQYYWDHTPSDVYNLHEHPVFIKNLDAFPEDK